jgi:hypothetical protein
MALVLNTLRKFPQSEAYLRAGNLGGQGAVPALHFARRQDAGRAGLGRIGEAIAKRAQAFGMTIRYHNRNKKTFPTLTTRIVVELAKNSDVLMIVTPGGADTAKLVNAKVLDALGPQGYLVNVARGSVVDEPCCCATCRKRKSPARGSTSSSTSRSARSFYTLDNAVLFPHVASATSRTRKAMGDLQVEIFTCTSRASREDAGRLTTPSKRSRFITCPGRYEVRDELLLRVRAGVDLREARSWEFEPKTRSTRVPVHLTCPSCGRALRTRPRRRGRFHSVPMSSRLTKKSLVSAPARLVKTPCFGRRRWRRARAGRRREPSSRAR